MVNRAWYVYVMAFVVLGAILWMIAGCGPTKCVPCGPAFEEKPIVTVDRPVNRSWFMDDHGRYVPLWIDVSEASDANEARAIIDACQKDLQRRIDNISKRDAEFEAIPRLIPLIDANEYR